MRRIGEKGAEMKLNIFHIPIGTVRTLESKLNTAGLVKVHEASEGEWKSEFYLSNPPQPVEIPWAAEFSQELAAYGAIPANIIYFGTYIWTSSTICLALSFGKSHFYLREFCDADFGLEMARRIGNKDDVRQKAARRYAGKRKKEIRSYQKETQLDIESGESVDYLQAATIAPAQWGPSAKFGASILVAPPIEHDHLPDFLRLVEQKLAEPPLFEIPRTEVVHEEPEIARYDRALIAAIMDETAGFEESAHQLVGVDFVFSGNQEYIFQRRGAKSLAFGHLEIGDLRQFIGDNSFDNDQILEVKVKITHEDSKAHSIGLKKALEYSIERERVFLQNGKWVKFNEDYATWLNTFLDEAVEIDASMEAEFRLISTDEPTFNDALGDKGYEVADKNFEIIRLKGYKVEAWDLKKDDTVYAVKFGTTQDLGYVCDQATNVLEILRNDPGALNDAKPRAYCLWLVFERQTDLRRISDLGSIILKQKLDAWARKCRELGIQPIARISRRPRAPRRATSS
jgi:uncharacterized protein (TIGR04141 family)